jgi:hypothetical protein
MLVFIDISIPTLLHAFTETAKSIDNIKAYDNKTILMYGNIRFKGISLMKKLRTFAVTMDLFILLSYRIFKCKISNYAINNMEKNSSSLIKSEIGILLLGSDINIKAKLMLMFIESESCNRKKILCSKTLPSKINQYTIRLQNCPAYCAINLTQFRKRLSNSKGLLIIVDLCDFLSLPYVSDLIIERAEVLKTKAIVIIGVITEIDKRVIAFDYISQIIQNTNAIYLEMSEYEADMPIVAIETLISSCVSKL